MQLKPIVKIPALKEKFQTEIKRLKINNQGFDSLLYSLQDKNIYIIGGFIRDLANEKQPRDIDMIIDVSPDELDTIIKNNDITFKKNRHNGYKLFFESFVVDCWSIDNNWAFVNKLIKKREKDLKCIAEGTFYNFDSLVFNTKTSRINAGIYNDCINRSTLDIIKSHRKYKSSNPTKEANIIRAFYLAKEYDLELSERTCKYIVEQTNYLQRRYGSVLDRLMHVQESYEKYHGYFEKDELKERLDLAKRKINKVRLKNQYEIFNQT